MYETKILQTITLHSHNTKTSKKSVLWNKNPQVQIYKFSEAKNIIWAMESSTL